MPKFTLKKADEINAAIEATMDEAKALIVDTKINLYEAANILGRLEGFSRFVECPDIEGLIIRLLMRMTAEEINRRYTALEDEEN